MYNIKNWFLNNAILNDPVLLTAFEISHRNGEAYAGALENAILALKTEKDALTKIHDAATKRAAIGMKGHTPKS